METPPRLLFVDDDAAVLRMIERLVRLHDPRWEVTLAHGGHRALELLNGGDFTAVITDLDMPNVDGFRVLEAAQRTCPDATRIVLTASPIDTSGCKADLVLSKLDIVGLAAALERHLSS